MLERNVYRAPLALACRDSVTQSPVTDGLTAIVWLEGRSDLRYAARRSPLSGMLGIGALPGLWRSTHQVVAPGDAPNWAGSPTVRFYAVIDDQRGRYLPASVTAVAPLAAPISVDLSSQPARAPQSGFAKILGSVTASGSGAGLGWAVVSVTVDGTTYNTIADARGLFLLYVPWPEALPPLGGGIGALTWPVLVSVRSKPSTLVYSPGADGDHPPQLSSIEAQPGAVLANAGAQPPLKHGQPLALTLTATPS